MRALGTNRVMLQLNKARGVRRYSLQDGMACFIFEL